MHTYPTYIIHRNNLITCQGYKLGILDNNFSGLFHLILYVFYNFPTNPIFFGIDRNYKNSNKGLKSS